MSVPFATILQTLKENADPKKASGMASFGINPKNTLGISVPVLRNLAKQYRKNHDLALELWESGLHEARLLAAFIDDPKQVTEMQMEAWVFDFDSWDVCDQVCGNLFDRTPWAYTKALEWSARPDEFVRRAGFALMAYLAVHDKKATDDSFEPFLDAITQQARDDRNFVRKAVNWALRQIGKRNRNLHARATQIATSLAESDDRTARWVGKDALRELTSEKVRLKIKI